MEIWIPKAGRDSATLTFNDPRDQKNFSVTEWDKVAAALGKPRDGQWEPLRAYIGRGEPGHFVSLTGMLTSNGEAWQLLKDDLKDEVEDLPIIANDEPFHIFSVLNVVDCVRMGVFDTSRLEDCHLFRLPPHPLNPDSAKTVYATDLFKNRAEAHQFSGIEFIRPPQPSEDIMARVRQGLPSTKMKQP